MLDFCATCPFSRGAMKSFSSSPTLSGLRSDGDGWGGRGGGGGGGGGHGGGGDSKALEIWRTGSQERRRATFYCQKSLLLRRIELTCGSACRLMERNRLVPFPPPKKINICETEGRVLLFLLTLFRFKSQNSATNTTNLPSLYVLSLIFEICLLPLKVHSQHSEMFSSVFQLLKFFRYGNAPPNQSSMALSSAPNCVSSSSSPSSSSSVMVLRRLLSRRRRLS